jgi:hypothetical protein
MVERVDAMRWSPQQPVRRIHDLSDEEPAR